MTVTENCKINGTQSFIIYKLERRSASLSGLAFDTNRKESTIKKYIYELRKKGYPINCNAGWFSMPQERNIENV